MKKKKCEAPACVDCPICARPVGIADAKKIRGELRFACGDCEVRFTVNLGYNKRRAHSVSEHDAAQAQEADRQEKRPDLEEFRSSAFVDCPICARLVSIADAEKIGEWCNFFCKKCTLRFSVNHKDLMSDYVCALLA